MNANVDLQEVSAVHIVGPQIRVGSVVRQLCSGCGEVLNSENLGDLAGAGPVPWPENALLAYHKHGRTVIAEPDEPVFDEAPAGLCVKVPS